MGGALGELARCLSPHSPAFDLAHCIYPQLGRLYPSIPVADSHHISGGERGQRVPMRYSGLPNPSWKRSTYVSGLWAGSISLPPGTCIWPSISLNILRWRGCAWSNMEVAHRCSRLGQQLRSVVRGVISSTSRPKRQRSTGSTPNVFTLYHNASVAEIATVICSIYRLGERGRPNTTSGMHIIDRSRCNSITVAASYADTIPRRYSTTLPPARASRRWPMRWPYRGVNLALWRRKTAPVRTSWRRRRFLQRHTMPPARYYHRCERLCIKA